MSDFEKKITDALSSPKTNIYQPISNDSDYYRNDTDMIPTNESYRWNTYSWICQKTKKRVIPKNQRRLIQTIQWEMWGSMTTNGWIVLWSAKGFLGSLGFVILMYANIDYKNIKVKATKPIATLLRGSYDNSLPSCYLCVTRILSIALLSNIVLMSFVRSSSPISFDDSIESIAFSFQ